MIDRAALLAAYNSGVLRAREAYREVMRKDAAREAWRAKKKALTCVGCGRPSGTTKDCKHCQNTRSNRRARARRKGQR